MVRRLISFALALSLAGAGLAQSIRVHVLAGGSIPDVVDCLRKAGHVVTEGNALDSYNGEALPLGTQVIYARVYYDFRTASASGLVALKNFASAGGGVILDGENYSQITQMAAMQEAVPVSSYVALGSQGKFLRRVSLNAAMNAGLPADMGFPNVYDFEVAPGWTAKPGSTVFYSLVTADLKQSAPAVVGWNYGRGRVLVNPFIYPSYADHGNLSIPETKVLLSNMVKWAARTTQPFLAIQDKTNGSVYAWNMTTGLVNTSTSLLVNSPGSAVTVTGAGDLNRDGQTDLVAVNTSTGLAFHYYLGNGAARGSVFTSQNYALPWKPIGCWDVNGDGFPDLFYAKDAAVAVMTASGFVPGSWTSITSYPGAVPQGVGDFDRDGSPDILFRRASSGQLFYLRLVNLKVSGPSVPITPIPGAFNALAVGDVNGDGQSEIFIQPPSRWVQAWVLDPTGTKATVSTVGGVSSNMLIRAAGCWY